MKIAYLSTPFSHPDPVVKERRYDEACFYASKLHELGFAVISPIIQGIPVAQRYNLKDDYKTWEDTCKALEKVSDVVTVCLMDGWDSSSGVVGEIGFAGEVNTPVQYIIWDIHNKQLVFADRADELLDKHDIFILPDSSEKI